MLSCSLAQCNCKNIFLFLRTCFRLDWNLEVFGMLCFVLCLHFCHAISFSLILFNAISSIVIFFLLSSLQHIFYQNCTMENERGR